MIKLKQKHSLGVGRDKLVPEVKELK